MASTKTAEIDLQEDGCLVVRIRSGARQSLDDARENLAETSRACVGLRRPLLVDISRCEPLTPEVRRVYTGEQLVAAFLALALLVEATPFGRMMGNVYLLVARLDIPTRLFAEEAAALRWLRTFLQIEVIGGFRRPSR